MPIEAAPAAVETPAAQPSLMDAPPVETPAAEAAPAPAPAPNAADAAPEGETPEQKAEREQTEAKAEEDRRAALTDEERAAEDKAKADAEGAPDSYADFTVPEGVALNAEGVAQLQAFGKEHNLSQTAAQQVVDMGVQLQQQWHQAAVDAFNTTRQGWREASQNDKEFGGPNLVQNMGVAVRAREQFGTPELAKLLNDYGLGDHPEVIRFFYRAGKATSEDIFVAPGATAAPKSAGALLYDHPTSQPKK